MEINYSKFKTQPRCKYCNNKLVDDITWRKYQLKKNFVGDRFALKDYELYGKIYNREICEACLLKNHNIEIPKKLNMLSYNFEYILGIPRSELERYCFEKRRVTKENMISRYGEVEGLAKWNEYTERQRYTNMKEYYVEKFGENWEEELNKTNSAKAITLENMILKYGEIEGKERYFKSLDGRKNGYSLMASNFFNNLESLILKDFPNLSDKIYFLPKNKEYCIHTGDKAYFYDFVITKDINICVEFYGDVFHANPNIYKADDKPIHFYNKDITSQEIWVNDNIKNNKIIERKFILFVVWESYLKIDSFTEYFYNSTLKGYINERKNS